jgi:hypothetical protein
MRPCGHVNHTGRGFFRNIDNGKYKLFSPAQRFAYAQEAMQIDLICARPGRGGMEPLIAQIGGNAHRYAG